MQETGSLRVRVFTSRAQLPIEGASVILSGPVTDGRRELLSLQRTDSSGVAGVITLNAPDEALSQDPGNAAPFASYTLVVEYPGYYRAVFDGIQVFSGVETVQDVSLEPLPQPQAPGGGTNAPVVVIPQTL